MPAILSKLKDDLVNRASNVQPGMALGVGVGVALAACALYSTKERLIPQQGQNNNNYKIAQNGGGKQGRRTCKLGARCGKEDCALCRGDVQTDNRQNIDTDSEDGSTTGDPVEQMPGLNLTFIKQLISLTRIMVPSATSREMLILSVHTLCLFTRTFLSIYVASLEGSMVKYIVKKDVRQFALMLMQWFGIAVPATFINSMIRFLESKLALAFRTRLVTHAYDLYFKNQTYYRVANLDGRIENADHRLTEDVSVFAASFAHLYGQLTKPCFDLLLIVITLARYTSNMKANIFIGPALASCVILSTGQALRVLSPQFGALAGEQARRAARLRHAHSRLIAHAEEVAFYGGHRVELSQLQTAYGSLASQMSDVFKVKLWYIMLEQFFMKYVWSGTGMVMLALPILTGAARQGDVDGVSSRTEYLTTSRNLLNSAADAIERLLSSYKEVTTLAGYASRVADMLSVFSEVAEGKCIRSSHVQPSSSPTSFRVKFRDGQPLVEATMTEMYDASISQHHGFLNVAHQPDIKAQGLPVYALLDECTSAVSMETECVMYEEAVKQGITLLSITHRPSVWQYHKNVLEFDGQGNWSFRPLPPQNDNQPTLKPAAPTMNGEAKIVNGEVKIVNGDIKENCDAVTMAN